MPLSTAVNIKQNKGKKISLYACGAGQLFSFCKNMT